MQQYVILGAGFDTFAFRRPDLLDRLQVFEVDHPATQALKHQRLAMLGVTYYLTREVVFKTLRDVAAIAP